ncbi:hypothetical protein JL722_6031 [Aureococcus anophagefferens]|nr:hypothetical protein JL722_6031 [Aureococcus anophagefferens]
MAVVRAEQAEADARRLTLRCETAERSLSDATARSDGANAARLKAETVAAHASKRLEEAEAELGAAKLRSAEAESTGAALGDQRHRDASRIAELEQKLENFASAVNVAELAKKAAEQKLRAAHEGASRSAAETAEADRDAALEREEALGKRLEELRARAAQFDDRYRDVERRLSESHVAGSQLQSQHDEFLRVYEKEHHAFQNSDRERQKLVARIASLERQLDFAAKARDARKHAEDARPRRRAREPPQGALPRSIIESDVERA